jgi:hypothetical protein
MINTVKIIALRNIKFLKAHYQCVNCFQTQEITMNFGKSYL